MKKAKTASVGAPESALQSLTEETFDHLVLKAAGPVAVEFMSYSCEHCRAMEPVLEQVATMVNGKEKIFTVNVATEQALADRFGIQLTPSFLMFLNGKKVGQVAGINPSIPSVLTAISHPFGRSNL